MNKQELLKEIEKIPKFTLRDVAQENEAGDWIEDEKHSGVTEEENFVNLAYVSKDYTLAQFSDVFTKMIEKIDSLEGGVIYYGGFGAMTVFPDDENLVVNGGKDKIGIVGINSVNKTSSVIIKFCVRHGDRYITMPRSIAGFKRMHVGKAVEITQSYLTVINKVKEIWKQIITEFEKITVSEVYVTAMLDELKIKDKGLRKQVLKEIQFRDKMDLWDVFMKMIAVIEDKSYKSDVHKRKRLDKISDSMFKWAIAGRLINA